MNKIPTALAIAAVVAAVMGNINFLEQNPVAFAGKNECDEVGTSHGDNSPSEKKFFQALHTQTLCSFTDMIDGMEIKGAIREDTHCDWQCFMDTNVFQTAFDDAKACMFERYDLPDDGKKNLEAYEIQACAQGNY